jgi:microcystin-dependent protein
MSEGFLAEIRIVGFNFAPRSWAQCDGQIVPINQNQALFSLLGTTYGGDGRTTFGLPDLRGRVPIHEGQGPGFPNHPLGQKGGEETHTLNTDEMPQHRHTVNASSSEATTNVPTGNVPAEATTFVYGEPAGLTSMNPGVIPNVGGGQWHNSMQPFLALNFVICISGLFPSRD